MIGSVFFVQDEHSSARVNRPNAIVVRCVTFSVSNARTARWPVPVFAFGTHSSGGTGAHLAEDTPEYLFKVVAGQRDWPACLEPVHGAWLRINAPAPKSIGTSGAIISTCSHC